MTIRWGIVSAGKICHDFVNAIDSYPDKGDMVVAAVAAREKSRAQEFAKYHNIPKVFVSYTEMAKSKDIGLKESPQMTLKDSLMLSKLMDTVRKQVGVHLTADDNEFKV